MEVMEEVWEVMEENSDDIGVGEMQKQVFRKKEQKSWDRQLQVHNCSRK